MKSISIFTIPKPFIGHSAVIQRNAIQSWLKLIPANQIYLFGNETGVSEIAHEFGLNQIADIRTTKLGTPLLSDAFFHVQETASTQRICYLNTDIILLPDFIVGANCIDKQKFLMVGRRWNFDVDEPLNFDQGWEEKLRERVYQEGTLFSEAGIDYFLFPRGMIREFPDFAVGRPGWDNWLIYNIRSQRIPVIDATAEVMVVHQNHDYSHVPQAKKKDSYEGPEADENKKLIKSIDYLFSVNDATHCLRNGKVIIDFNVFKIANRIERQDVLLKNKPYRFFVRGFNYIYKRLIYLLTR
jgi:hypothetical protein